MVISIYFDSLVLYVWNYEIKRASQAVGDPLPLFPYLSRKKQHSIANGMIQQGIKELCQHQLKLTTAGEVKINTTRLKEHKRMHVWSCNKLVQRPEK